ncbi:hypothetical protein NCCP1664_13650 [Zafaria cholistanensis]|uniref:Uncharacterized protein n=1 Tax=Zafaria cholistanensis TaxID=1682741 RepID=A0A5A7NSR4_9MICC|nr:hypothetical protein NCCP1664_13650 [Zafaria cholistanensis]
MVRVNNRFANLKNHVDNPLSQSLVYHENGRNPGRGAGKPPPWSTAAPLPKAKARWYERALKPAISPVMTVGRGKLFAPNPLGYEVNCRRARRIQRAAATHQTRP